MSTAPDLSAAEAEKVAEFEAAEPTVEHMTGVLLTAILGDTDGGLVLEGELPAEEIARLIAEVAAPAALAVFRGQQDPAVQRVLALCEIADKAVRSTGMVQTDAIRAAIGGDGR